jgi:hypothetical protein
MASPGNSQSTVLRCPVCRAQVENGPHCRRCRADLGLLFTLERQRAQALRAAREAVVHGHGQVAVAEAERARRLRWGEDAFALQALACLVGHDFAGAWQSYLRARRAPSVARTAAAGDNE